MGIQISESDRLSFEDASTDAAFSAVIEWIDHFLCASHPELGRLGDVCPFARTALTKRSIAFFRNRSESVDALAADIEMHMDEFLRTGAHHDIYQCRIIVPTRLDAAAAAVDSVQKRLKPAFVQQHLMLGQFYQGCPERGLWNATFRPLQSPVPLLAIRNMVPTDVAFLYGNESYMHAYLEKFGNRGVVATRQYEATMETNK